MAGVVVLLAAAASLGQPPDRRGPVRGGPTLVGMLRHKAVQDELKLTEGQREKVKDVMMGMRDKMLELIENGQKEKLPGVMKELEKGLRKALTAAQYKRLKQVILQVHGLWAMMVPETAKELKLTPAQEKKLLALRDEAEKEIGKLSDKATSRKELQKKLAELHRGANSKALAVLSEAQRGRWKEMIGEPFKGDVPRVLPGAGRRRPGGKGKGP
jgi:Spy/CpxP family protein refolding chaperone